MITWERLRVLDAVAEQGSVGAAAAVLHITAPAVSQQLRKLDREAGTPIVEAHGRGVRLTAAGRLLAGRARTVAATVQQAERELAELHDEAVGPVQIGSLGSVLRTLVPRALLSLATDHPGLVPHVHDGEGIHLVPRLATGELDLAVVESFSSRPVRLPARVELREVLAEPVYAVVSEHHPRADDAEVRLRDLAEDDWTACPPLTDPYEALVQALRDHGLEARIPHLVTDYNSQLALVAAGRAVALIPGLQSLTAPPGVRFLPCDAAMSRRVVAAHAAGGDTPAVRAVVAALQQAAQEHVLSSSGAAG